MRLFFIEDEEESRKGILKYVNWKKLGIDSVIPFSNSLEALECAKQEHVDIVLSDIRMPHMNGIELCQSILKINPSASIIFISGYSDKEYLLSAIQMSAVDYVEKPINIPQLEAAIERAILRISQLHSVQKTQKAAIEIIQKNRQFYIDQIVIDLIHGRQPSPDAVSDSEILDFPLKESDFYRVYLWHCRENTIDIQESIRSAYLSLANQNGMPPFLFAKKDDRNYLFVMRFSTPLTCDTQQINMQLMHSIHEQPSGHSLSCSYGNLIQGAENIRLSYNQAVIAMQKIFYIGYGTLLPYEESSTPSAIQTCPPAPLSVLVESLRKQDRLSCENCLKGFYKACSLSADILPDIIKNEYFKLLSVFIEESSKYWPLSSSSQASRLLWKQLNTIETLRECHNLGLSEIEQYFNQLKSIASDKRIILEVMQYIGDNYANHELYIEEIAKKVYMSPNYLSTFFKKTTGKTIGGYITEVRLEQSCQLLKSNKKLSDIALAVGYTDVNYYSKLFKKYYHMTPSEYRNHMAVK